VSAGIRESGAAAETAKELILDQSFSLDVILGNRRIHLTAADIFQALESEVITESKPVDGILVAPATGR